jgi:hypothetical protein
MSIFSLTTLFVAACASAAFAAELGPSHPSNESDKSYSSAISVLDRALNAPANTKSEADFAHMRDAATEGMGLTQNNHLVKSIIARALDDSEKASSERAAKKLRRALIEAKEILSFRPVLEALIPDGFPKWTPVGEIRVQKYPEYRLARTKIAEGDDSAFFTLFDHIASNEIAMTAPVEMSYRDAESENPRSIDMAFLYKNMNLGRTGSTGKVDVIDVPAKTALSIGVRGETSPRAVAAAHACLKAWLAEYSDKYVVDGDLRVLGYNSPMIPADDRYFEVQIPVRRNDGRPTATSDPALRISH